MAALRAFRLGLGASTCHEGQLSSGRARRHHPIVARAVHHCRRSEPLMDLVTLVTACALSVEPKLMHALIWHQSGGEPWAVSVRNEPMPRVYSSMQEALSEMRAASGANGVVRVGLTGLPRPSSKVNPARYLPCLKGAIAAERMGKLVDRCNTHRRLKNDPIFCAVAVYRGSWEQPDVKFAEAVIASAAKGDAPNFDLPKDINVEFLDIAS